MDVPPIKNLLAFLLALKNFERNPSDNEKLWWEHIASQIQLKINGETTSWKEIEQNLLKSVEADDDLKQLYQKYLEGINNTEYDSIIECIPSGAQLQKQFSEDNGDRLIPCGSFPVAEQPDWKTDEILNVTVYVLTKKDPITATKDFNFIEKLQQIINLPNKRGRSN